MKTTPYYNQRVSISMKKSQQWDGFDYRSSNDAGITVSDGGMTLFIPWAEISMVSWNDENQPSSKVEQPKRTVSASQFVDSKGNVLYDFENPPKMREYGRGDTVMLSIGDVRILGIIGAINPTAAEVTFAATHEVLEMMKIEKLNDEMGQ